MDRGDSLKIPKTADKQQFVFQFYYSLECLKIKRWSHTGRSGTEHICVKRQWNVDKKI